jgi:hypothetical protein
MCSKFKDVQIPVHAITIQRRTLKMVRVCGPMSVAFAAVLEPFIPVAVPLMAVIFAWETSMKMK